MNAYFANQLSTTSVETITKQMSELTSNTTVISRRPLRISNNSSSYFGNGCFGNNAPVKPMKFEWLNKPITDTMYYTFGK